MSRAQVDRRLAGSWRCDRRTFLKLVGASAAGVSLAIPLGLPFSTPVSASVDDLAFGLEYDLERIFRFVADHIRYEPYAGVLRGADGTLTARSGNSADQAVLLAALLKRSGIDCRFAQGALDDRSAAAIMASAFRGTDTAAREFLEALTGRGEAWEPTDWVTATEAPPAATLRDDGELVTDWARARLFDTASTIEGALAAAAIAIGDESGELPALERDGHVWVQAALGTDWLDLDPSIPGAIPGESTTVADLTHADIPSDLRHRLTLAVVAEVIQGGMLREDTLVEVDEFADVLAGVPVGVLNVEREGFRAIGADIVAGLEGGGTTYLPCIAAGEDVFVGPGAIHFGGASGDPFGESEPGAPGTTDGEATAEWLVITTTSPGAETTVIRREIFDRLGPAAREAGQPDLDSLPPVQLVALEPDGQPEYLPAQRSHWLTVHVGTFGGDALAGALAGTELEDRLTNTTHAYHVLREATGLRLAPEVGTRLFARSPNLVATIVDLEQGADAALGIRAGLDILRHDLGAIPIDDTLPTMPPGLAAGITAHIAERLLMGDGRAEASAEPRLASVGALFEAAQAQGIAFKAVTAGDAIDPASYPPDAAARLRSSLARGLIAVLPERSVRLGDRERVGWWLIDPASGYAFDEMDDGRGVVFGESTTLRIGPVRATPAYRRLAVCAAVGALVGANLLGMVGGAFAAAGSEDASGFAMGTVMSLLGGAGAGTGAAAALTGAC